MLVGIEGSEVYQVRKQAHGRRFRDWMRNLPVARFQAITDALNEYVDTQGRGEIITTSWIPGADWTGKPYEAIYEARGVRLGHGQVILRPDRVERHDEPP